MKERRRFRPTTVQFLESRLVLNGSVHIAPVTVGHVTTKPHATPTRSRSSTTSIRASTHSRPTTFRLKGPTSQQEAPRGPVEHSGSTLTSGSSCWQPN